MTQRGVVRMVCGDFAQGQTTAGLGQPELEKARRQHREYVEALEETGLVVTCLPPLDNYPDSCFVEDAAVVVKGQLVQTRPGHPSRRNEAEILCGEMGRWLPRLGTIQHPGTLDGGDVLVLGERMWIGLTDRTNPEGAGQLADLVRGLGMTVEMVPVAFGLHLKTFVGEAGENRVLISERLADHPAFSAVEKIIVQQDEEYACNCRMIRDRLILPAGFPGTRAAVVRAGILVREVALSEFQKMDGGVSCLSVVW